MAPADKRYCKSWIREALVWNQESYFNNLVISFERRYMQGSVIVSIGILHLITSDHPSVITEVADRNIRVGFLSFIS